MEEEQVSPEQLEQMLAADEPSQDSTANIQQAANSEEISPEQLEQMLGPEKYLDENTGESIASLMDGGNPDAPTNDPILTINDRFKMSYGNEAGRLEYLKAQYEDAAINSKGKLVVKKDGRWNYADPEGYGQKDPVEVTKEVVADLADFGGDILVMGSSMAAAVPGAVASLGLGGAPAAVAGAMAGAWMKSSLGRLAGTYSATPEQQIKDTAVEGIFQLAGEKFIPGAKWGTQKLAKATSNLAKTLKVKEGAKAFASTMSRFSIGKQAMDTLIKDGDFVARRISKIGDVAGNDPGAFVRQATDESVRAIESIVNRADKVLDDTFVGFKNQILKAVPDSFEYNVRKTALQAHKKSVAEGLVKVMRGGKEISDPTEIAKLFSATTSAGRVPKGTTFQLRSQQEIKSLLQRTGNFDNEAVDLITGNEAYGMLKQMHDTIELGLTSKQLTGKAAAKQMMDFKKQVGKKSYELFTRAQEAGMPGMQKVFKTYGETVDNTVKDALDTVGQGNMYSKMNLEYGRLKDALIPLKSAKRRAKTSGSAAYEGLYNKLMTKPGKGRAAEISLEKLVGAAKNLGDTRHAKILSNQMRILDANEAALAINPYVNRTGASGAGMLGYAASTQNVGLLAGLATKVGLESNAISKNAVRSSQIMWKGLQYMKSDPKFMKGLVDNATAASAFANTLINADQAGQAVANELQLQLPPIPTRIPEQ